MKQSQIKALQRLCNRRYPSLGGYSTEQGRELAALSRSINRQIGVLINRQGRPALVLVGDTTRLLIPELQRSREGAGRLRGLRFLHTHLTADLLTQDDLMDLLFLRLDSMTVLTVNEWGEPIELQRAHLLPPNPEQKSYQTHPPVRWDQSECDYNAEATALEEELGRTLSDSEGIQRAGPAAHAPDRQKKIAAPALLNTENRVILVSVSSKARSEQESSLAELAELAQTAGLTVAGTLLQRVHSNPRYILGKGRLADLEISALQANAGLIVFDGELSPAQLRNLTDVTERRILDRTQLILDIFARRASSRAGKYQVELAQLQYMLPRLVGKSRALDRLAGGIGGRGPGETKLETDRRRLRDKITRIKKDLEDLRRRRSYARARRAKGNIPVVSLVGYTNAGKSTLLNALTGSNVLAENKLFATLDPTTRRLRFPEERELILTDTVGFIRSLPKELVEAFRATLEELQEADLLLHVADAAHPELEKQIGAVEDILAGLELKDTPRLLVFNKIDQLPAECPESAHEVSLAVLQSRYPEAVFISAAHGDGLSKLSKVLVDRIDWTRDMNVDNHGLKHFAVENS